MITNLKRKDLLKIKSVEDACLYNEQSLVADKLRSIYVHQGWSHMTKDISLADDNVQMLTDTCIDILISDEKEWKVEVASAGLKVIMFIDEEDFINVDYYFHLM